MLLKTNTSWNGRGKPDHIRIVTHPDGCKVVVRFPDSYRMPPTEFPTLARALHTLGGMIPWESWSDETREGLLAVNHGKMI